jgi:SAM-dependent MidA family methyltransferase
MSNPARPWRDAWQDALYGPDGFFRLARPAEHFRTSVTASTVFAEAIARLCAEEGLPEVVDMGAGGGELLAALHAIDPSTRLTGVELASRPDLPGAVGWTDELPDVVEGLLIAHEWLDNVPCDVVEVDADGVVRLVEVEPDGTEHLGAAYRSAWLDRWWPLTEPGARAEVGEPRDDAWEDAVGRVHGVALAIDYGHTMDARPPVGTLTSFAAGREVDVVPDGSRDITAHVAVDAVAERTGATVRRQRDALADLGVGGSRPPLELATSDPARYVAELSRAGDAAELRARGGWGDFWWLWTDTRVPD